MISCAQAHGQDALGSGNVLDANSNVLGNGSNVAIPPVDYRARNLIVTNDIAGGRGFRESVGYFADQDFRGSVGSDDLQTFRSYSALSSPILIMSPRANDQFNLAQNMGMFEYRRDYTTTPSMLNLQQVQQLTDSRIRLDRQNYAITNGNLLDTAVNPSSMGLVQDSQEESTNIYHMMGSALEGMKLINEDDRLSMLPIAPYERIYLQHEIASGTTAADQYGVPFTDPFNRFRGTDENASFNDMGAEFRLDQRLRDVQTDYDRILEQIIREYADDPSVNIDANPELIKKVIEDMKSVNQSLNRLEPDQSIEIEPQGVLLPDEDDVEQPMELDPAGAEGNKPETNSDLTPDEMATILKHRVTIDKLTGKDRGHIDTLMENGSGHLAKGEYFKAEKCFEDVLIFIPGDPLALAGLMNSQLGAGLYLSASLSLNKLLLNYPEMAAAKYSVDLLPNETRLRLATKSIQELIKRGRDVSNYGLLLAFIGYQLDQPTTIEKGLSYMNTSIASEQMRMVLERIWLTPAIEDPTGTK